MLKCLFVDLTSIESTIPKSKFKKAQIEKLADLILANDGLICPLILIQTGVDRYKIIDGDLAYYGALRAKEKDLHKAEMVNAFVIPAERQQLAIEQLALLSKPKSTAVDRVPIELPVTETITPTAAVDIDELFARLSADIARQLAPFSQQLATVATIVDRHELMLRSVPAIAPVVLPTAPSPKPAPIAPPTNEKVKVEPKKTSTTTRKTANSKVRQQPEQSIEVPPQELAPASVAASKKSTTTKKTAAPKNPAKSDAFAGMEPEKLARTLELVNTSNLSELTLMMSRSGIANAQTLAASLIAKRDTQPQQMFESWQEIVLAKVARLTQKLAVDIINKLK